MTNSETRADIIADMREALIKIRNEIRSYCYDYGDGESHKALLDRIMNDPPDYTSYEKSILEIDRIVEAALAAPPRNCDRFNTASEAHIAFQRFCRGNYRQGLAASGLDGCDNCELCETKNMSGEDSCPFFWLFGT